MSVTLRVLGTAAALFLWQIEAAPARSLDMIRATGALHLCAHPNSLPYANKAGNPPGFQIELGKALAKELGVTLVTEWIVVPSQAFRADCDIILDAIADPKVQADTGLRISKAYYRSGVGLAVPRGSTITTFAGLNDHTKVGVQVGSVAAMLGQNGQCTVAEIPGALAHAVWISNANLNNRRLDTYQAVQACR